jgi:DNA-binding response OmpR family regulator
LSNSLPNIPIKGFDDATGLRRALLIDADSAARLEPQLTANGYETRTARTNTARRAIEEFAPHVVLMELSKGGADGGGNQDCLALARKLRAEPATYALPLVFVFEEDERDLRNAALRVGADDYFSVEISAGEMLARLDALFWRTEAGRRAASVAGDQRLEIDNFIMMLDAVRTAMRAGESGTLALVYPTPAQEGATLDKATRDRTLLEAHGFLKLNLRRVDEVTFYGPTTLLVYLPRANSETARSALSRLREQFIAERAGFEIAIGLASFPLDGDEVESLIEKAEAAALLARDLSRTERVKTYLAQEEPQSPRQFAEATDSHTETAETANSRSETTDSQSWTADSQSEVAVTGSETAGSQQISSQPLNESPQPSTSFVPVAGRTATAQLNGAEAVKAAIEAGARELERRAGGAIMPRRLLLTVSDAARMAQINALIRSAGYEARAAFDGQQALDLLRIERPDLLLLDYQLQGMNGVETLRRLRKQSGGRLKLPVVLLLPQDQELAREEALELGARDVVTMPYDPVELLTSVRLAGNAE